jgi:hypothetical protein
VVGVVYTVVPPHPLAPLSYDDGEPWYGILKGKYVGVTQNHALALDGIIGVSRNSMRSYKSQVAAVDAFNAALTAGVVEVRPY